MAVGWRIFDMGLEHILLGLLQKPASGYDLKTRFDNEIHYFWAAELTQIYGTLRRLEKDGLLTSRVTPSAKGPDRRVYALTTAGRDALRRWLADGPELGNERFGYLGQVYLFAAAGELKRTLWFLTDLRRVFNERLRTFRQIESEATDAEKRSLSLAGSSEEFHRFLALRAGILAMTARRDWCDEAIEHIERRLTRDEERHLSRRESHVRAKARKRKGEKK